MLPLIRIKFWYLIERDPICTIKKAEEIIGAAEVSKLQESDREEVKELERNFAQTKWASPVFLEGDLSKIKEEVQSFANRWEDKDKPFSAFYGSSTQSVRQEKKNRYMALALLRRLETNPQETINYLRDLASKAPKETPTLERANSLLGDGNYAQAAEMYKELQGNPATAAEATTWLTKMRDAKVIQ